LAEDLSAIHARDIVKFNPLLAANGGVTRAHEPGAAAFVFLAQTGIQEGFS
jgi:hypothetical protein